jgi:hypothetical protein
MFSIPITLIGENKARELAPHIVADILESPVGSRVHMWCRIYQPGVSDHIGFVLKPIPTDNGVCTPEHNFHTQHYSVIRIQDVFLPLLKGTR